MKSSTLKAGIVGPEERNLGEKDFNAVNACNIILVYARLGMLTKSVTSDGNFIADSEHTDRPEKVVLVSGRCPVSVCEACGKRSYMADVFPVDYGMYTQCESCGAMKKRRAGGVDIYAENAADKLGIEKEVHAPQVNEWEDKKGRRGFRTRNMDIAKSSDVLWVVTPRSDKPCKHCGSKRPGHVSSGGCWTGVYAEKIGKRVIWVIL